MNCIPLKECAQKVTQKVTQRSVVPNLLTVFIVGFNDATKFMKDLGASQTQDQSFTCWELQ